MEQERMELVKRLIELLLFLRNRRSEPINIGRAVRRFEMIFPRTIDWGGWKP